MATITDILISELDPAVLPAKGTDELVLNQLDPASGEFVTRRISWQGVGESIQDLSGDPNYEGVNQILFADGTEPEPSITFRSDISTGIYKPQYPLGSVAVTCDAREVMRVTPNGVGINLTLNEVPSAALHVKTGTALFEFGTTNKIHLKSYKGEPVIDTVDDNNLNFATKGVNRGRFTNEGAFEIYGALGVGGYVGGVPVVDHGTDGYVLLSKGQDTNPEWTSPYEYFNDNADILQNLLLTGNTNDFLFYNLPSI